MCGPEPCDCDEETRSRYEAERSRPFDPEEHPKAPAGSPTGGQFTAGNSGGGSAKKPSPKKAAPAQHHTTHAPAKTAKPTATTQTTQRPGDPHVRKLQSTLNKLGLTGPDGHRLTVDGANGPETMAAIKAAQERLGLPADGKVTTDLLNRLADAKALVGSANCRTPKHRTHHAHRSQDEYEEGEVWRSMDLTYAREWPLDDIVIRSGGDGRTVEAYAAVFDTPTEIHDQHGHYMERVHRSAFNRAISHGISRVGVFYHHGMTLHGTPSDLGSVPIASPVEIRADDRGLLTVSRYNKSALADSVLESIRNGDIRGYSFKGRVYQSEPKTVTRARPGDPLPTITRMELGLSEYGPTPSPAYAGAGIVAVRSMLATIPDERLLQLLRTLPSTPVEDDELDEDPDEEDTATSTVEPGAEDPPQALRSAADTARRIRVAMLTRGM